MKILTQNLREGKKQVLLMLFTSLLLFSTNLLAQNNNCQYSKNEVDEFTGRKVLITKKVNMYNGLSGGFGFSCTKYDSTRILSLTYATSSIFTIEKGNALMFILDDGTKVELKASETLIAKPYTSQFGTTWSVDMSYIIPENEYKKIVSSPFKKLRIYTSDYYSEKEFKARKAKKVQQLFFCIK
jgi:hypothetical protein